jgi:hypothetical protein
MKNILTILLLVAFSVNVLLAQRNKPGVPAVYKPTVEKLEINDAANDFGEKGLPQPEIIGSNPSDKLAAKLAKEISKYDENSLPLVMTMLQKAGFYIIDENQKILYKPIYGKGMGMAFYDFEVAGMLKLSRAGIVTTVGQMAGLIGKDLKKTTPNRLGELMLADLKTAANSKDQTKRFWARLIIAFGKEFPQPVDLLTATPETAQINIIQASLWERRLIGDLIATATQISGGMSLNNRNLFRPKPNVVSFANASFTNKFVAEPCDYTQVETLQVDVASTAMTTIHGKTLGVVIDAEIEAAKTGAMGGLEKVGTGLGIASVALSWAKLIAAMSQMKGEIAVEEPLPLIRTKHSRGTRSSPDSETGGAKKELTGKFYVKMNDLRKINCFRLAANMLTGLEFSMPGSGPLSEKPVSWEMDNSVNIGRNSKGYMNSVDDVAHLIGTTPTRDFTKQETDANGVNKIYIEGGFQKEDLSNKKVVPVPKKAKVRADVALKNMKDTKQEKADIGGFALGVVMGGGILGILGAIPEIGNRMKVPVVSVSVPIRDWMPCSEDWGGIINVKREYSKTFVIRASRRSNGNSSGDGVRTEFKQDEIDVTLNPRTAEEILQKAPKKPADVVGKGIHSDITTILREGDPCCGEKEGKWTTQESYGTIEKYSGFVRENFNVGGSFKERDYDLSFYSYGLNFPGTIREFKEVDSDCDLDKDEAFDKTEEQMVDFSPSLMSGRYGNREFNSEGELLWGEKVLNAGDQGTFTWKWALARCQK